LDTRNDISLLTVHVADAKQHPIVAFDALAKQDFADSLAIIMRTPDPRIATVNNSGADVPLPRFNTPKAIVANMRLSRRLFG